MRPAVSILVLALLLGSTPDEAAAQLRTSVIATGLTNPVAFVVDPSDSSTFLVVEQRGTIRSLRGGVVSPTMVLDLRGQISSGGERGLLGLAFPLDAVESRRLFVNFTNPDGHTVVARYTRDAQGRVDPHSRFDLVWPDGGRFIEQPFSNHNGGHLAFGPDGYLYIGLGDGGSGGDPMDHAQNPNSLLGKMLRLDVGVPDADARGYQPLTNPIHDYPRSDGQSITGGVVYRGTALDPMFNGRYFVADYVAGQVYSIGVSLDARQDATAVDLLVLTDQLGGTAELGLISSFGVDAAGEMYIVSYSRGRILKIVP